MSLNDWLLGGGYLGGGLFDRFHLSLGVVGGWVLDDRLKGHNRYTTPSPPARTCLKQGTIVTLPPNYINR